MLDWINVVGIIPRPYTCGYCGNTVAPDRGYQASRHTQLGQEYSFIYICSGCRQPTWFDGAERQWPAPSWGARVAALPPDVNALYDEARRCMSVSAYTTAVMACRKMLMHIAVDRGANTDQSFRYYVDWLAEHHFVPPGGEGWVSQIRTIANEANHEIVLLTRDVAERLLSFVEMLLKFIYEFPARAGQSGEGT
jgi:hypothetical protein